MRRRPRKVLGVFLAIFSTAVLASVYIILLSLSHSTIFQQLLGPLIGLITGFLGSIFGIGNAIIADARSNQHITYFPSQKDPWLIGDWVVNISLFGGFLVLLLLLVYGALVSSAFPQKPFWYTTSLIALTTLSIAHSMIVNRIIRKTNRKMGQVAQL